MLRPARSHIALLTTEPGPATLDTAREVMYKILLIRTLIRKPPIRITLIYRAEPDPEPWGQNFLPRARLPVICGFLKIYNRRLYGLLTTLTKSSRTNAMSLL